jgi:MscS family membrane protein
VVGVAKLFSPARARTVAVWLILLTGSTVVRGQGSSLLPEQKPAAAPQPAAPTDPLGRETPRGTLNGFIRAAQEESAREIEYLQPSAKGTTEEAQELASQLFIVLNTKFPASALGSINNEPDGRGEDQQPRDQIKIGGTRVLSESFPITLVRLADPHNVKLWFI